MTTETETNRGARLVGSLLPWLLGAGMLAVYLFTLEHGLTPSNVSTVTHASGWDWRPTVSAPLTFLATLPFKWVPTRLLPLALNVFSAICASLSLVLLARSVALLPHDRTHEQRLREENEFSLLTFKWAWAPLVLAVLVCGLQMTFWENAIAWTGEMLDLLVFAYVIRCLLEYRVSGRESWVLKSAFVLGLGMANNWGIIGFFPLFVGALIWIRGVSFFNPRALLMTLGCGLLGFALILLLPLIISFGNWPHFGFWEALRYNLALDKQWLAYMVHFQKNTLVLLALTSLLPLFIISLRWASYFGDTSPLGIFLATATLHVVHALFFLACLWVALDGHVSPRHLGAGINYLTFYYLGALCVGYFCGYFLLVFGTKLKSSRERTHPFIKLINVSVTILTLVLFVATPALLVIKNLPDLRARQANTLAFNKYVSRMEDSLPAQGGVVLSDEPIRLNYLQDRVNQTGDHRDFIFIDTSSLSKDKLYLRFLERKYPTFHLHDATANFFTGPNTMSPLPDQLELIKFLDQLSKPHGLYYLHPSFGYFFERFHLTAEGVVYRLEQYGSNEWTAPLATEQQISQNQEFWQKAESEGDLPRLRHVIATKEPENDGAVLKWLRKRAHLTTEPDATAAVLGTYYSRALNYWGVELQKSTKYSEAAKDFEQAQQFNPENVSAKVNLQCNQQLQAGKKLTVQQIKGIEDKFGKLRDWVQILDADGPFDEPSYCLELGSALTKGLNFRQAIQQYDRAGTMAPDSLVPPLLLAQMFLWMQDNPTMSSTYMLPYDTGYTNVGSPGTELEFAL